MTGSGRWTLWKEMYWIAFPYDVNIRGHTAGEAARTLLRNPRITPETRAKCEAVIMISKETSRRPCGRLTGKRMTPLVKKLVGDIEARALSLADPGTAISKRGPTPRVTSTTVRDPGRM